LRLRLRKQVDKQETETGPEVGAFFERQERRPPCGSWWGTRWRSAAQAPSASRPNVPRRVARRRPARHGVFARLPAAKAFAVRSHKTPQRQHEVPTSARIVCETRGIRGHDELAFAIIFKDRTLCDSSPNASAQYISASFRYRRPFAQRFCRTYLKIAGRSRSAINVG
jgi:hypothetical protein